MPNMATMRDFGVLSNKFNVRRPST